MLLKTPGFNRTRQQYTYSPKSSMMQRTAVNHNEIIFETFVFLKMVLYVEQFPVLNIYFKINFHSLIFVSKFLIFLEDPVDMNENRTNHENINALVFYF